MHAHRPQGPCTHIQLALSIPDTALPSLPFLATPLASYTAHIQEIYSPLDPLLSGPLCWLIISQLIHIITTNTDHTHTPHKRKQRTERCGLVYSLILFNIYSLVFVICCSHYTTLLPSPFMTPYSTLFMPYHHYFHFVITLIYLFGHLMIWVTWKFFSSSLFILW